MIRDASRHSFFRYVLLLCNTASLQPRKTKPITAPPLQKTFIRLFSVVDTVSPTLKREVCSALLSSKDLQLSIDLRCVRGESGRLIESSKQNK